MLDRPPAPPRSYLDLIAVDHGAGIRRSADDEYDDLRALLMASAAGGGDDVAQLADALALAALGANHLWQDLGLADRAVLNRLMADCFPDLARANTPPMRWKKFLYRELCRRDGFTACRAPCCDACALVDECFAPEDGLPLTQLGKK